MSSPGGNPAVFVHGLWLHADSWAPWLERFDAAGYTASAPGWPGDGPTVADVRRDPSRVAGFGISEIVDHYARILDGFDRKPVVVGHSFGGLIALRLLEDGHAAAAVAIDAAPAQGILYLPPSAFRVASVGLRTFDTGTAVSLTPKQFRYGFANELDENEATELYERWTIPSPTKPLFQAASANFVPHSAAKVRRDGARGPLLLIAGGKDHTVPAAVTKQMHRRFSRDGVVTDFHEFPDRAHSLTIDHGWSDVADTALDWLGKQAA